MPDRSPSRGRTVADRTPAQQRELLAATVRFVADWRSAKAEEFPAEFATEQSQRAVLAINQLAEFVEGMADDDRDLMGLKAMRNVEEGSGKLIITPETFDHLSRFGMQKSAWLGGDVESRGVISERQMRNELRRLDGIESRERAAEKRDTS
jgi:hypothetical protein